MKPKIPSAVERGRLGGLVKNPKRAAASRRNGHLGGRPRRDGQPPQPRAAKAPARPNLPTAPPQHATAPGQVAAGEIGYQLGTV